METTVIIRVVIKNMKDDGELYAIEDAIADALRNIGLEHGTINARIG